MFGLVPAKTALVLAPFAAPVTFSGNTEIKAPNTTSTTRWHVFNLNATLAGATQLSNEPVGILISIASKIPLLFGNSGSRRAFKE